ncbi:class I SAM-dependent methyltransferase [Chloroflexota bacterium]
MNRPYLKFARYTNYFKLIRIAKVVDEIEAWTKASNRKTSDITVLDVGCGHRLDLTLCLASLGYNVIGVDMGEETIALAREKIGDFNNVRLFQADAKRWLTESKTAFNLAILLDVAEHMKGVDEFFPLLYERLSSPGLVLVTVPYGYSEVELLYRPFIQWMSNILWKTGSVEGLWHINRFSLKRLRNLFVSSGFEYKFVSSIFTSRPPFFLSFFFGFRGLPAYLNIKAAAKLPPFMTSSWLVRGIKRG